MNILFSKEVYSRRLFSVPLYTTIPPILLLKNFMSISYMSMALSADRQIGPSSSIYNLGQPR